MTDNIVDFASKQKQKQQMTDLEQCEEFLEVLGLCENTYHLMSDSDRTEVFWAVCGFSKVVITALIENMKEEEKGEQ